MINDVAAVCFTTAVIAPIDKNGMALSMVK